MKLLFGISGSIAAIKTGEIVDTLRKKCKEEGISIEIKFVATKVAAEKFLNTFEEKVLLDEDEWLWEQRGDVILHIELRRWADLFTCICRCWDFQKTCLVFPCMNSYMYNHPVTKVHTNTITSWGIKVVNPVEKILACGEYGMGALPNVDDVTREIVECLKLSGHAMQGSQVNPTDTA
ncbi:phosphopantothenoylcysteine decarboxylase, putative [Plasmodium ovale wallikeri]|uniref:Phosphopantothenoylcysteine decarboxylase, putative n=1 Tax=Plasmodium ovale wallikeri TaxID=864142 RepID=A0A1A8YMV2_PLAOA|nr:phosphopantothenoylcysteine decarboxylase, putative [Plasmodium ovale wallikeri]